MPVSTGRIENGPRDRVTMLLGYPFPAMRELLEQNLDRPNPYILAVARTDVTLNPFDREQMDSFIDHLTEHPLRERFIFVPPLETLRYLTY